MSISGEFTGRVALVTGGGSGIGRATAMMFAALGAQVAVADMSEEAAQETVRLIQDAGGEGTDIRVNVADPGEVEAMVQATVSQFGTVDYAVNSAGIAGGGLRTHEYPLEEWHRILSVNLTGVWLSMKYELAHMVQQQRGAVVNVSSAAGLKGQPGAVAYTASKHGVIGATRSAALEYARSGIRINAVCPSAISTPMWAPMLASDPNMEQWIAEQEPLGRMGQPEEVAQAIVWLCSDAASFINGHALAVDGGLTVR